MSDQARYHDRGTGVLTPPELVQGKLGLFDSPESSGATVAALEPHPRDASTEPAEARYFMWIRDDTKLPVAQKIADAVGLYAASYSQGPNVCMISHEDHHKSGITPGEVVAGVRVWISGYVKEHEFKVGKE